MFCQKCGNKLVDGAKFCNACGQSTDGGVMVAQMAGGALVLPAPALKRFFNFLIDTIFRTVIFLVFSIVIQTMFSGNLQVILFMLSWMILVFGYHLICESIWQRTLGKIITKTKVVDKEGNKPSFWKILGRTFARLIPFEPFSFLFSGFPVGWHDSLSGTYVVSSAMTSDEVKKINVNDIQKTSTGKTGLIIVVAVFIAIAAVGILSSIVLVSLNTARQKGADAAVTAQLNVAKAKADLFAFDNGKLGYVGVCKNTEIVQSLSKASLSGSNLPTEYVCNEGVQGWAGSVPLKSGGYWCVDAMGYSKMITDKLGNQTFCSSN